MTTPAGGSGAAGQAADAAAESAGRQAGAGRAAGAAGPGALDPAELGRLRREGDSLVLTQSRTWPVAREEVWSALTAQAHLPAWLGTADAGLDRPGPVRVDHGGRVSEVLVHEVDPGSRVRTTWHGPDEGPADLTVALAVASGAQAPGAPTTLTLTYSTAEEAQVRSAAAGWLGLLDGLAAEIGVPQPGPEAGRSLRAVERLMTAVALAEHLPVE